MLTRRELLSYGRSALACAGLASLASLTGCGGESSRDKQVIIYSSCEGERNEALMVALRQDLPDVDVRLHYLSTGNLAARLRIEREQTECDIALGLEAGYLMAVEDVLVNLTDDFDLNVFEDDLHISDAIMPLTRECGCFAHNTEVLGRAGVEPPASLDDLLDARFSGKISMPNPKASSTGYNFYYSVVNRLGQDAALDYFDELAQNVYQFTSSGGAPASALTQGEAGVGLSLVFQLVAEKNDGSPLQLDLFPEGVPWTMNGISVVSGHEHRQAVWDVMRWFYERGILLDKQKFVPDKVFKDQDTHIEGYPTDLVYADMNGLFDLDRKEELLTAWKY
jgi:iron(III) transport system substrate-binding protein